LSLRSGRDCVGWQANQGWLFELKHPILRRCALTRLRFASCDRNCLLDETRSNEAP
jgi:hypothetical protein